MNFYYCHVSSSLLKYIFFALYYIINDYLVYNWTLFHCFKCKYNRAHVYTDILYCIFTALQLISKVPGAILKGLILPSFTFQLLQWCHQLSDRPVLYSARNDLQLEVALHFHLIKLFYFKKVELNFLDFHILVTSLLSSIFLKIQF